MVRDGFGGLGHRLQKVILFGKVTPDFAYVLGRACRMNPRLAARRGDADGDILDCAAETTHRMTFEMRQHNRKIVIQVVLAHEILFQVLAAFYRQGHFAVGIHDVHFRNRRKTVVGSSLEVCLRIGTSATIGRIALHDCAVHFPYKWCNECRLEKIMSARFAGGEFYRNLSFGFTTESLVDLHKIFRGNFLDKIDLWEFRCAIRCLVLCLYISCSYGQKYHCSHYHAHYLFHIYCNLSIKSSDLYLPSP